MIKLISIFLVILFSLPLYAVEAENEILSLNKNYFAFGDKSTPIKLEFSFKHRLFETGQLYFGYHQKFIWDVNNGSSPILDSNYNPQIFYDLGRYQDIQWSLGLIEHISNGQSNDRSRGINMSFIQGYKSFIYSVATFDIGTKFFVSYKKDNGSPDINEYMGTWALMVRMKSFLPLSQKHSIEYRTNAGGKYGTKFGKGQHEFNFYFQPTSDAQFSIFAQYFIGRNEYLLQYKTFHEATRIGISLLF